MSQTVNRRRFLQTSAVASVGYWVAGGVEARTSNSPNERIAMASIGVGGKGHGDSVDAACHGDMVAICDVDTNTLNSASRREGEKDGKTYTFKKAKKYTDFRKMLDEMGKSIDAVTVSTTDHVHAPAGLMAMRMGKHCFCQKPLTRTIYEARLMGEIAREMKVATQMGNQGTADDDLRQAAAWLRTGVLGEVKEHHVWTNRPIWPQGIERGEPKPVPPNLDWDLWLAVAPKRPYADNYHGFRWRGWWDFGTGALGDIACHSLSMAFMGLGLTNPISVEAKHSGHNKDSFPSSSVITFEFAPTETRGPVKFVWYDGGELPPKELLDGREPSKGGGNLTIGTKGKLFGYRDLAGVDKTSVDWPKSPGHFEEWVRAIRGGEQAMSNFPDYAGPLTETVLLGNLALWAGEKVEWDPVNMRPKNVKGLRRLIKPRYRKGYTLDV